MTANSERCRKRQRVDPETTPGPSTVTEGDISNQADIKEGSAPGTSVSPQGIAHDTVGPDMAETGHPHPRLADLPSVRTVMDGVLSPELCRELIFVFRSSSTVGYRPHVRSATIHDVAATAPWLLPPLVRARHAVLSAVEAAFGLSLELAVEFTGLIGWSSGAALGWHHDANREYLARRHVSAVLYLNSQGDDFDGGDFRFQDGLAPLRVEPRAGRLVAYTTDRRNVHCVEEVSRGERCTFTCWFSLEPQAAEDPQVMQQLCRNHIQLMLLQPRSSPPPSPPPRGSEPPPPPPSTLTATTASNDAPPVLTSVGGPQEPTAGVWSGTAVLVGEGALVVLSECWWRQYLGRGLPTTMYQLPKEEGDAAREERRLGTMAADGGSGPVNPVAKVVGSSGGGGAGGDIRLERLRHLGLYAVAAAGRGEGPGEGFGKGEQQLGEEGVEKGAEQATWRPGNGTGRGEDAEGCVLVGLVDESEGGVTTGVTEVTYGSSEAERLYNTASCSGALLLWFPNLSAALLAAQFAWFATGAVRFRSAGQLQTAVQKLPEYAERQIEDLLQGLTTWLALGSMLSAG